MSALAAVTRALAVAAEHGPELLETATELAKLGTNGVKAVNAWVNGDGPEPTAELERLPETSKSSLALARLEGAAASGTPPT